MTEDTLTSGQTFQWFKFEDTYYTTINGKGVKLIIKGDDTKVIPKTIENKVKERLGANVNLQDIYNSITVDEFMQKCVNKYRGMTLVNEPFYPTLISFITSSQNRIERIKKLMWKLRKTAGDETEYKINTFPDRNKILKEKKLKDLGFGYRADYINRTCKILKSFPSEKELSSMELDEARETLKELVGVGNKVADCVLLYSLGFNKAVPIDSWMKKIIKDKYPSLYSDNYIELQNNITDKFGQHSGYAQLYMFHYYRNNS